jgi:hypothetical protein
MELIFTPPGNDLVAGRRGSCGWFFLSAHGGREIESAHVVVAEARRD